MKNFIVQTDKFYKFCRYSLFLFLKTDKPTNFIHFILVLDLVSDKNNECMYMYYKEEIHSLH